MIKMMSLIILLTLIMDPLGNLPIFISILKNIKTKRSRIIILREMIFALLIMILFVFLGEKFLSILKLKKEILSISGGIILFIISLKMIFPEPTHKNKNNILEDEPFIVPLAIPLISGPSLLATLILLSNQYSKNISIIFFPILISWGITTIILISSSFFLKILGKNGINALERLMGLILILLSTQMFLEGLQQWFK